MAIGAIAGAIIARFCAPLILPFFRVPDGGVGFVTIHQYPKGWDYAVLVLVLGFSFLGGVLANAAGHAPLPSSEDAPLVPRKVVWILAATVFVLMLFVHDQPYVLMDMFHEGEHLTPAFLMREGSRPYGDIFLLHGLAVDGGLDALFMGTPPSPWRVRRLNTILNAATLALLVPLAAEVCVTTTGLLLGVLLSLTALGAGQAIGFPFFRLAPLLVAAIAYLRYARTSRPICLAAAFSASTLGLLWSLDTGMYAIAATGVLAVTGLVRARRLPSRGEVFAGVVALALPLIVLLIVRADIRRFLIDSFVIIPAAIDAVWSLPVKQGVSIETVRYYGALVFYGVLLALAWSAGDLGRVKEAGRPAHAPLLQQRIAIFAIFAVMLFRTAAGRMGWGHTRYAMPFIGIAAVAFLIEPLIRRGRGLYACLVALPFLIALEVADNIIYAAKSLAGWPSRQEHSGLVPYPLGTGKGLYTTPQNATELAALNGLVDSFGPEATFFDFSNERALYYLLKRAPPVRCPDVPMLSNPILLAEAMAELNAHPPACVIVAGEPVLGTFDGIPNAVRVPDLARWIDANYPRREQIGRFTVGLPENRR